MEASKYRNDIKILRNFKQDLRLLTNKILLPSTDLSFSVSVLTRLLDAATMLAVCESEYPNYTKLLGKYSFVYGCLEKVLNVFNEYGITLNLPEILHGKIHT